MSRLLSGLDRSAAAAFSAVELSESCEDLDVDEESRVYLECEMLTTPNPWLESLVYLDTHDFSWPTVASMGRLCHFMPALAAVVVVHLM